jgi:hypothetical protein
MQIKSADSSPEPSKRLVASSSSGRSSSGSKISGDTSTSSGSTQDGTVVTEKAATTKLTSSAEILKKPTTTTAVPQKSAGKSVFSRLGDQETEEETYVEKKPVVVKMEAAVPKKQTILVKIPKVDYTSSSSSSDDEEYGPKPPVKEEKPSIFDRLEKVKSQYAKAVWFLNVI